jgi:protein phosphatase
MGMSMNITFGERTETNARPFNADRCFAGTVPTRDGHQLALCCVADGVGSCDQGARGADIVIEHLKETLRNGEFQELEQLVPAVEGWCLEANRRILAVAEGSEGSKAYTTFTGVIHCAGRSLLIHVGDSRAYWLTEGSSRCLTADHTHANYALASGVSAQHIQPDDWRTLARCFDGRKDASVDLRLDVIPANEEGWILVTSDGVHDRVGEEGMLTVASYAPSAAELAGRLVGAAVRNGSRDNATAAVMRLGDIPQTEARALPWRDENDTTHGDDATVEAAAGTTRLRRWIALVLVLLLLFGLCLALIFAWQAGVEEGAGQEQRPRTVPGTGAGANLGRGLPAEAAGKPGI